MKQNAIRLVVVVLLGLFAFVAVQRRQAARLNAEGLRMLEQGQYQEAVTVLERAESRLLAPEAVSRNLAKARQALRDGRDIDVDLMSSANAQRLAEEEVKMQRAGNMPRVASRPLSVPPEQENALRQSADARIARMKTEGWKDDDASFAVTIDAAEVSTHMENWKSAITLYERALFKHPDDLTLEIIIQEIEAQVEKEKTKE